VPAGAVSRHSLEGNCCDKTDRCRVDQLLEREPSLGGGAGEAAVRRSWAALDQHVVRLHDLSLNVGHDLVDVVDG
jgi:hypothetical protein